MRTEHGRGSGSCGRRRRAERCERDLVSAGGQGGGPRPVDDCGGRGTVDGHAHGRAQALQDEARWTVAGHRCRPRLARMKAGPGHVDGRGADIGQRQVITKQERQPIVFVLNVQRPPHIFRILVNEAEDALVLAGQWLDGLELQSEQFPLAPDEYNFAVLSLDCRAPSNDRRIDGRDQERNTHQHA